MSRIKNKARIFKYWGKHKYVRTKIFPIVI